MTEPLFTGSDWDFDLLAKTYEAVEEIGVGEMGLDIYPNEFHVISAEQMIDFYTSVGMPVFYNHWSFGKQFVKEWESYKSGASGLAYELVINSKPCINYLMEQNSMTTQALVMAHAAMGHNCFSEDTEILTQRGWKYKEQINKGDIIATLNRDTLAIEYHPIEEKFEYDYDGELCHFKNSCMDHLVTPNHKMVFMSNPRPGSIAKFKEVEAKLWTQTGTSAIAAGISTFEDNMHWTDDDLRLMVWCVTDGSLENPKTNYWRFHLLKQRKIDRLSSLLTRLGVNFKTTLQTGGTTKISFNKEKLIKYLPHDLMLSKRQFDIFAEEWLHTDGSIQNQNDNKNLLSGALFTNNKDHVDKIQELAALSGAKTSYRIDKNGVYRINIRLNRHLIQQSFSPLTGLQRYKGKVWCVSVKNHTLISRRNGKVVVTGNSFFKNNYLFKEWTDADSIVDYLIFAKEYVAKAEAREGKEAVESFLDSCHALQDFGINRYKRPQKLSLKKEMERQRMLDEYQQSQVNEIYHILPDKKQVKKPDEKFPKEPEENFLYFFEKNAPNLKTWQRELLRIVRKIAQYLYPQGQTKVANEGTASYFHYHIMNRLHEKGLITNGSQLEFLALHSGVINQPAWSHSWYNGINPYKLGFEILRDIDRICAKPTDEDRYWAPQLIGQNSLEVIKDVVANYRDESLIRQFLSPKLIRDFGFFKLHDNRDEDHYLVTAIQNERGYQDIRDSLANQYEREIYSPRIEIVKADPETRILYLEYTPINNKTLEEPAKILKHVRRIWGYTVQLHNNRGHLIASIS